MARKETGRIAIDYKEFEITYSENENVWRCYAVNVEAPSLQGVKNKINAFLAEARRMEGVAALLVSSRYNYRAPEPCRVQMIAEKTSAIQGDMVWVAVDNWVMWRGEKINRPERRKVEAKSVVVDTQENRALIAAAEAQIAKMREAEKSADHALAAIPRIDLSAFKVKSQSGEADA